jgi:glycosyltransferase involved in cell wall biosynthesis
MKRLNVLIVAHEFSPEQGSECAVGWNYVTRIAKYHDVTVIYASGSQFKHKSYFEAVERFNKTNGQSPRLTFINIDQPSITKLIASFNTYFLKISSIGLPILYFIGYNFWQKAVYKKSKQLHIINHFDIVHQLTPITFREPGYLWKIGVPFFWGPTGGTYTMPKGFLNQLSLQGRILEKIRDFSNFYQFNYVHRIKEANKKAKVIYTFSKEDAILLNKRASGTIKTLLDAGTYVRDYKEKPIRKNNEPLIAIWCGQLIERKAPSVLLQAIANGEYKADKIKFIMIGDGPLKESLIKLANELNIQNVEWIYNLNHEAVFELMRKADFFIHTSYREGTPHVIQEALSMGLPVICHDANGMSIAINESCGIKIPLLSFDESVIGFQKAIHQLLSDQVYLEQLKKGANARTEEISWDAMAVTMANDYLKIYNDNANTINK